MPDFPTRRPKPVSGSGASCGAGSEFALEGESKHIETAGKVVAEEHVPPIGRDRTVEVNSGSGHELLFLPRAVGRFPVNTPFAISQGVVHDAFAIRHPERQEIRARCGRR